MSINLIEQVRWLIEKYLGHLFDISKLYGEVTQLDFVPNKIIVRFSNTRATKEIALPEEMLEEAIGYLQSRFGMAKWRELTVNDSVSKMLKAYDDKKIPNKLD